MASVKVIERKPFKLPPPIKYVLTLTKEEAEVVHWLTGEIGCQGDARNLADNIFYALSKADIDSSEVKLRKRGGIYAY